MKVHLITTNHRTAKNINPHDAKMEMLMEENNRLKKQLEVLMRERNDDIENVFRNKLEHVRSSSRSISKRNSKTNLSPKLVEPLKQRKNQSNKNIETTPQNKCNVYLRNKNYVDSEASIKENMEKTLRQETTELKNKEKCSGSQARAKLNAQYLESKQNLVNIPIKQAKQPTIMKQTKQESKKMVECPQQLYAFKVKRRAIYEKQSEHNISKSLQRVNTHMVDKDWQQKPKLLKKLRNTIYVQQ